MLLLFVSGGSATVRSPRAPRAAQAVGDCPGGAGADDAQFPVYYTGCDNGIDPGPGAPPPPPGCPTAATQTFTASFAVPPEPEVVEHQIIYWGIRVESIRWDPIIGEIPYFISAGSAGITIARARSGSRIRAAGKSFAITTRHFSRCPPATWSPPQSPAPQQATRAR